MKIKKKSLLSPKVFNYLYSIGASIVILGSLFKLLHTPGADFLLILGMGTEAFIFFVSAFDEPAKEPNWDKVYPGIYDSSTLSAEERAVLAERRAKHEAALERVGEAASGMAGGAGGGTIIIGGGAAGVASAAGAGLAATGATGEVPAGFPLGGDGTLGAPLADGQEPAAALGGFVVGLGGASAPAGQATVSQPLTPEQGEALREATDRYVEQLTAVTESLARMQAVVATLGESSDYAQQMAALTRNVAGLNTIYEIQLKSVSAQLGTIEQVNQGLANIRSLYENGQNDSFRIRQETDQMARTLQQLNQIYARMLQAMALGATPAAYASGAQPFAPAPQPFAQAGAFGQPQAGTPSAAAPTQFGQAPGQFGSASSAFSPSPAQ